MKINLRYEILSFSWPLHGKAGNIGLIILISASLTMKKSINIQHTISLEAWEASRPIIFWMAQSKVVTNCIIYFQFWTSEFYCDSASCYANHLKCYAKQLIQATKRARYIFLGSLNQQGSAESSQQIIWSCLWHRHQLATMRHIPKKPLWSCFHESSWPHRRLWCSCITDLPSTHTIINIVTLRYCMTLIISDKIIQPLHARTT